MDDGVVLKYRTLEDMRKHPWSAVFAEGPAGVAVGAKLPIFKAQCAVVYELGGTERILLVDGAARERTTGMIIYRNIRFMHLKPCFR
jgi:hypothetical protein